MIGNLKTGTTSLAVALAKLLSRRTCKWDVRAVLSDMAAFASSPAEGNTSLHGLVARCGAMADNPWWLLAPQLLAAYPNSRFILTRWSGGCEAWITHFEGLYLWGTTSHSRLSGWERSGINAYHRCIFGASELTNATRHRFVARCEAHERTTLSTARRLHSQTCSSWRQIRQ